HGATAEDRRQERAGGEREDEEDQVHLLDQPGDQERQADQEIEESFAGEDRALGGAEGPQNAPGELPEPPAPRAVAGPLVHAHVASLPVSALPVDLPLTRPARITSGPGSDRPGRG